MKNKSKQKTKISRRGMLPLLGGAIFFPFMGFSATEQEEYQTLLKPDGTTVRVKVNTIKRSKVIKKNVSNTSFFNWLKKQ